MKNKDHIRKMILSAMFLALAYVLPFFTGQIPQIGSMLCPMHLPVFLCGFICGWPWGLAVGLFASLLRSVLLGMPKLFPTAICMAFELATYGALVGFLYQRFPKKRGFIYAALIAAMAAGRLVWGAARLACEGFNVAVFNASAFWADAITTAIPGIIVQIVLIPILVMLIDQKRFRRYQ